MANTPEDYKYRNHPGMASFKEFIRTPLEEHPWLTRRQKEADAILNNLPEIPSNLDPRLLPHPADQGLMLTPFDEFDGMHVAIPPQEHREGWRILYEYNMRLAIHPARISAMKILEQRGFIPPKNLYGVINMEAEKGRLLQLSDLGHAVDITDLDNDESLTSLLINRIYALRITGREDVIQNIDMIISQIESQKQAHRTELLATGPFTIIKGKALSFVGVGAMPDITGSVLAGITAAKMFVPFNVPEIGMFSDPHKQAALAKAILDQLTPDDPLLENYSDEDKQYIVDHWKSCVTIVTESDVTKALHRAELADAVGATSFRPYGHTRGGDIIGTVRALRRHYPEALINASQISGVGVALAVEYEGADVITLGVASGGRCTTGQLSNFLPTNAVLAWNLRGVLGIPIIGEGGAIDEPITSALVGFSGVNGSGSIGGGTFEAPGGCFFLTNDKNTFYKPYGGEASSRFKWLSGRKFGTGIPYIPEGEQTMKTLDPLLESMTQRILDHWTRVVLGGVVLGIDSGPFEISDIQNLDPSPLWYKTRTTSHLQNTH